MNDFDMGEVNICDESWNDLNHIDWTISFSVPVASGLRFRYLSEIDKKSFSLLKSEKNLSPILRVETGEENTYIQVELITENSDNSHFNMLYQTIKDRLPIFYDQEPYIIPLREVGIHNIPLDNLGIRKMKQKEAILRIQKIYPKWSVNDAKQFFNNNKLVIRLKATLYQFDLPCATVISDPIKSQIMKENTNIRIQHISPKMIAGRNEEIIIVLEKKITVSADKIKAYIVVDNKFYDLPKPIYDDQQTFIFNAPQLDTENPIQSKFIMKCGDHEDSKQITFMPLTSEQRKRKFQEESSSDLPLKRSTRISHENSDSGAIQPLPESGDCTVIQMDNMHMETDNKELASVPDMHTLEFDNESRGDSGIHSTDPLSDSFSSSDDDSDAGSIETEGIKRQSKPNRHLEPVVIKVSPKIRSTDSRLNVTRSSYANQKILSEVARIGHDFAFGQKETNLFDRVASRLPVVFTLQDDVGDTPLNNAILKGNVEQAFKILSIVSKDCPWALDLVNTSGHSALILAPACDVPAEFIDKLLAVGCRLDLWDDTGKSAIIYAIEYKNVKALESLLRHVSMQGNRLKHVLSRYENNYNSPLQIAVINEFKEGIEMLLNLKNSKGEYLVDVNEIGVMNDETALHMAVQRQSSIDITSLLLNRPDIEVNKLSNNVSALHMANERKLFEVSALLKLLKAVDLPHIEEDNIEDSDDGSDNESTVNENETAQLVVTFPEIEMVTESQKPLKIEALTSSMRNMSLKGEQKKKIIDLLLKPPGPTLNMGNLEQIVKPSFVPLFKNHANSDKGDYLERFNCLPNSIGQLLEILDEIGRIDMKLKIINVLSG